MKIEKTPVYINNVLLFIDYIPAELREGKDWLIVYYVKNPTTGKLERQRLRVPKNTSVRLRRQQAKQIIEEINGRLLSGWNPYLRNKNVFCAKYSDCCTAFLKQADKDVKKGVKREVTARNYVNFLSSFNSYLKRKEITIDFIVDFSKDILEEYLDYVFYQKKGSAATYNNYLRFFNLFFDWLVEKGYVKENVFKTIKKQEKQAKKRTVIEKEYFQKIRLHLEVENFHYLVLCMTTYCCLIRRTELTKLRVCDVELDKNIIVVRADVSKTKKQGLTTIPYGLLGLFAKHLQNSEKSDYLFSDDDFKPGKIALNPLKITHTFRKIRRDLNLPNTLHFYSFKDTGIMDLLESGLASIKVRNQARHSDLKTTAIYTHQNTQADLDIIKRNLKI